MTRVLAVANQKGGVAKTTTVASLGAAFAEAGRRVLLVDLDPQGCLTFSLGTDPDKLPVSVHEVLLGDVEPSAALVTTTEGMTLLPANIDLAGAEAMLLMRAGREYALKRALAKLDQAFDVAQQAALVDKAKAAVPQAESTIEQAEAAGLEARLAYDRAKQLMQTGNGTAAIPPWESWNFRRCAIPRRFLPRVIDMVLEIDHSPRFLTIYR